MTPFKPTNKSAFLSGVAFIAFYQALTLFGFFGAIPNNTTEERFLPFLIAFFVISAFVFVFGFERWQQGASSSHIPFSNIPKTKEDMSRLMSLLKRMLFWFFGAASAGAASSLVLLVLK